MTADVVVVGSGPNGLVAAAFLARTGFSVTVFEGESTVGGGCRSAALTLPGFIHDICAAVHPLGISSPGFASLPLAAHGLNWRQPEIPLAHPLDDGSAALLERSLDRTAAGFGRDGDAYRRLVAPFVARWSGLVPDILAPAVTGTVPRHPLLMARFGLHALRSVRGLVDGRFVERGTKALFAGLAVHGLLPLERPPTASFAMVLGAAAHAVGWPLVAGGSQNLADALAACVRAAGGDIVRDHPVRAAADIPPARAVLFDISPRHLLGLAGDRFPLSYRQALRRFRHGPGVFKVDWALSGPIPWRNGACRRAGTVHLGGTFGEIARSERQVWLGGHPDRPAVLLVQPTVCDASRAPAGKHVAWAYCHVPAGSPVDMAAAVEAQVERFASGFKDLVIGRHVMPPAAMEAHNPNYIGGDITGGVQSLRQTFFRPVAGRDPYRLPVPGWFLCSASTPPGGGVHGMCGLHAAQRARHWLEKKSST
ncbi:MAG: NAD(P)/FAD-dependent oxidoreductase [Deltaproteobacteria bacterium]|nr:NAD(P)/FAD-dependent oxidoreductase [Candidatus Anaeroferrophillacea bacterium]